MATITEDYITKLAKDYLLAVSIQEKERIRNIIRALKSNLNNYGNN